MRVSPVRPKAFDVAADECPGVGRLLDEQAVACSARQRFDAEGARSGEQVDNPPPFNREISETVSQNIEDALAHAVRSRANARVAGRR